MKITNEDNMLLMARYPDKYFDLAIVDPPYGIKNNFSRGNPSTKKWSNPKNGKHSIKYWDKSIPNEEYFNELFRVSKNQIIWGGNYMTEFLPPKMGWIFWDKKNGDNEYSDGELAWTSFNKALRKFEWLWNGFQQKIIENRIHPTQKPAALYKWILDKYAKQGDKILDTHLGSGSIAIACHDYGFDLSACELDKEYFDKAMERINNHMAQTKLFT